MKQTKKTIAINIEYHDHSELVKVLDEIKHRVKFNPKEKAQLGSAKFNYEQRTYRGVFVEKEVNGVMCQTVMCGFN